MTPDTHEPRSCYALISGGGTGGHVIPALAIGDALVASGIDRRAITFVGSARGIEAELVPAAGYEVVLLPGRGIQRRFTWANLGAVWGLVKGIVQAFALVGQRKPAVVVSVGGYASVPTALAAAVRRVPIVVAEQNGHPGAANRLVARFAKAAAVAFEGTPLPRSVVTGNPVRAEITAIDRARDGAAAKASLGVDPDRTLVVVMGGSLGALRINRAVVDALPKLADRADLTIRHVIGRRDHDTIVASLPDRTGWALDYQPVAFEHDMPTVLAAADLAVCRPGSSTCFELAAAELPAVLVPSPFVTGDHQSANARHFAAADAAAVVADADLDADRLVAELNALVGDPARRTAMAQAMGTLAAPDAAAAIAELARTHAKERS